VRKAQQDAPSETPVVALVTTLLENGPTPGLRDALIDALVRFTSYGHWGGAEWSGGAHMAAADLMQFANALVSRDPNVSPVDKADAIFRQHDLDYARARSVQEGNQADARATAAWSRLPPEERAAVDNPTKAAFAFGVLAALPLLRDTFGDFLGQFGGNYLAHDILPEVVPVQEDASPEAIDDQPRETEPTPEVEEDILADGDVESNPGPCITVKINGRVGTLQRLPPHAHLRCTSILGELLHDDDHAKHYECELRLSLLGGSTTQPDISEHVSPSDTGANPPNPDSSYTTHSKPKKPTTPMASEVPGMAQFSHLTAAFTRVQTEDYMDGTLEWMTADERIVRAVDHGTTVTSPSLSYQTPLLPTLQSSRWIYLAFSADGAFWQQADLTVCEFHLPVAEVQSSDHGVLCQAKPLYANLMQELTSGRITSTLSTTVRVNNEYLAGVSAMLYALQLANFTSTPGYFSYSFTSYLVRWLLCRWVHQEFEVTGGHRTLNPCPNYFMQDVRALPELVYNDQYFPTIPSDALTAATLANGMRYAWVTKKDFLTIFAGRPQYLNPVAGVMGANPNAIRSDNFANSSVGAWIVIAGSQAELSDEMFTTGQLYAQLPFPFQNVRMQQVAAGTPNSVAALNAHRASNMWGATRPFLTGAAFTPIYVVFVVTDMDQNSMSGGAAANPGAPARITTVRLLGNVVLQLNANSALYPDPLFTGNTVAFPAANLATILNVGYRNWSLAMDSFIGSNAPYISNEMYQMAKMQAAAIYFFAAPMPRMYYNADQAYADYFAKSSTAAVWISNPLGLSCQNFPDAASVLAWHNTVLSASLNLFGQRMLPEYAPGVVYAPAFRITRPEAMVDALARIGILTPSVISTWQQPDVIRSWNAGYAAAAFGIKRASMAYNVMGLETGFLAAHTYTDAAGLQAIQLWQSIGQRVMGTELCNRHRLNWTYINGQYNIAHEAIQVTLIHNVAPYEVGLDTEKVLQLPGLRDISSFTLGGTPAYYPAGADFRSTAAKFSDPLWSINQHLLSTSIGQNLPFNIRIWNVATADDINASVAFLPQASFAWYAGGYDQRNYNQATLVPVELGAQNRILQWNTTTLQWEWGDTAYYSRGLDVLTGSETTGIVSFVRDGAVSFTLTIDRLASAEAVMQQVFGGSS
jgi:hypothetical protein